MDASNFPNVSNLTHRALYRVTDVVVVVVDPLLPDYWGESASVVRWGFAASFSRQSSSRAATPEGSLHKSRADSVVGICGQLKRCCVVCSCVRVTDNLVDCIQCCRGLGLLAAQMTCPTCQQPMRENADQKGKDGLRWK